MKGGKKVENKMKEIYYTFIKQDGKDFLVYVPDMDVYTEGHDLFDAIIMARDAIGLKGVEMEDDGRALPAPSDKETAIAKAKADADADFDFSDGVLTLVDIDFTAYRNKLRNKAVKKNCTIPYWLNKEAEKLDINFSQVLQEALLAKIAESHEN